MDSHAYRVDVRTILEDLGGTIAIDAELELPVIELGTETFAPIGPARLVADITNTGAGIVASGTTTVTVQATCSRCLREFPLTVEAPVEGFYVLPGHDDEIPEEQEVGEITDGSVDLMEQLLAALALELPFAPLHAPDCPGICPSCGADLAGGPCACEPLRADSPFAALKDLLPPGSEG